MHLWKLECFKQTLVEIRVFQADACGRFCDTETSTSLPMLRTCASAPTSFFPVLPHCGGMSLCALSACTHVDVVTSSWLKFDEKHHPLSWYRSFCFNAQDPRVIMSVEQAHQRLGIAEGVIHELQEQLQRVSAGHQAVHQ